MKSFLASFSILLILLTQAEARQPEFTGMVELKNGQKIHAIHFAPETNQPTIVFLHGLTYTTKPWEASAQDLADKGFGVLMYDMRGMGKTLEASGPVSEMIPVQQQVDDLALLLEERKIDKAEIVGLSYGGAVGLIFASQFPDKVTNLILLAPFVKALKAQDDSIKQKIRWHRMMRPTDKRSDDELYDEYLRTTVFQTYPIYEPVVKEHPWRLEAVYQMVRGVRKFVAKDMVSKLPAGKTHLVVAGKDQYVPSIDLQEFWEALSSQQKVTRINVQGSEHKLPEAVPHFLAGWIHLIVSHDSRLTPGSDFVGNPSQGTARSSGASITGLPTDSQRGLWGMRGQEASF